MHDKFNAKSTQFERNYKKAYIRLLSAATAVDEYFFGTEEERDEDSEEIRPYFYAFMSFCLTVGIWLLTQN